MGYFYPYDLNQGKRITEDRLSKITKVLYKQAKGKAEREKQSYSL